MNDIVRFEYKKKEIRVFKDENGETWWVVKDVCAALGISNYRDAIARLDEDERGSVKVDTPGGPQEMATINESGNYTLMMRSNKSTAKSFRRWLTHEVLPTLRKTGTYSMPGYEQKITEGYEYLKGRLDAFENILGDMIRDRTSSGFIRPVIPKPVLIPRKTIIAMPIDEFLANVIHPDVNGRVLGAVLYRAHQVYSQRSNRTCMTKKSFIRYVLKRYVYARYEMSGPGRHMCFVGIKKAFEPREKGEKQRAEPVDIFQGNGSAVQFVRNECVTGTGYWHKAYDLWQRYCIWCVENGGDPLSKHLFYKAIRTVSGITIGTKKVKGDETGRRKATSVVLGLYLKGGDA